MGRTWKWIGAVLVGLCIVPAVLLTQDSVTGEGTQLEELDAPVDTLQRPSVNVATVEDNVVPVQDSVVPAKDTVVPVEDTAVVPPVGAPVEQPPRTVAPTSPDPAVPVPSDTAIPAPSMDLTGFELITSRPFEIAGPVPGWGWSDNDRTRIVSDPSAPASPPDVLEGRFTAGCCIGNSGGIRTSTKEFQAKGYRELYVRYWIKYAANWTWHPSTNKVTFVITPQGASSPFFTAFEPMSGANGSVARFRVNTQGKGIGSTNYRFGQIQRGEWAYVEVYSKLDSAPGRGDGQLTVWVNRSSRSWQGVKLWDKAQGAWRQVKVQPIYGGGRTPVPHDQTLYIDHVEVWGR